MVFSTAERLAALDRSAVRLDPERCLHAQDKYASCEACFDFCPVDAIQTEKPPALVDSACERCYACLPICPTGAYTADDAVPALLQAAARAESGHLELLCARHPAPEQGSTDTIGIQVRGCLAGLGASAYLSLAALGKEGLAARTDACADCPWGGLLTEIEGQIETARRLLAAWGSGMMLSASIETNSLADRPCWAADNPPLSRRDLFRLASRQGQVAAARAMTQTEIRTGPRPSRERFRTLQALDHLPGTTQEESISLEGLGFASLTVSEACTACQVCARACPTGALTYASQEDASFVLAFDPRLCIGCEICTHLCAVDAVAMDAAPQSTAVFTDQPPMVLQQGGLTRCSRCLTLMADRPGRTLCPVCTFRRENPFGSAIPPGLLAQRAPFQAEPPAGNRKSSRDPEISQTQDKP